MTIDLSRVHFLGFSGLGSERGREYPVTGLTALLGTAIKAAWYAGEVATEPAEVAGHATAWR
jgi:hypothetical protein